MAKIVRSKGGSLQKERQRAAEGGKSEQNSDETHGKRSGNVSRMDAAKGMPYHFGWVWQDNTKSAAREALEFFTSGFLACGILWGFMETSHNVLQPVRSLGRHGRWGCLSVAWDFVENWVQR